MRRAALVLLLAACSSSKPGAEAEQNTPQAISEPAVNTATAHAEDRAAAMAILERYECSRCHEGTGAPAALPEKQCVGCHQEIQSGRYQGDPELVAKWSANIHSLQVAPSFASIGKKLRRSWVRGQILHPRDMRPALEASMPRIALSESEADTLARHLVPAEAPERAFPELAVQRGAQLFDKYNCNACHGFGDRMAAPRSFASAAGQADPTRDALLLAPDLLHTRERFQPGALVAWLMDPQALQPSTLMPNFKLSESEAASLAAYIWHAAAKPLPLPEIEERLPLLEREVGWDEVFTKVFKTVCWHCHSSKEFAMGDGGPGNTGGFGYAARGLDLSSYEAILSGSIGADGKRRSVFVKNEQGVPLIVESMLVRKHEERGEQSEMLGMPLGFPSMSPEQIQLVESWLAQGRPR